MPRIDAHQHFWRIAAPWHAWPDATLPALHRDFLPPDLAGWLARGAVDGTVLVQSQPCGADTDWMLDLAGATPFVLGVVGWVDLLGGDAVERIEALARHPKLKGLRPMLQDLAPGWILQAAAAPAIAAMARHGLVFDALIRPQHLPDIARLAERHHDLTIVIDHAAKPAIATGRLQPWATDLAGAAAHPNVACKLSGLATEAGDGWTPADLAPYVDAVLALFGAERVLWGSDWPVVALAGDYATWLDVAASLVPPAAHAAVLGDTAARLYRLDVA